MSDFHFIIDESKFHFQDWENIKTIWIICCIEVWDIEEMCSILKDAYRELSIDKTFGKLRNDYPHYTEDSHHQRLEISTRLSKLWLRSFIGIWIFDYKIDNSADLYPKLLKEIINPIIRNYINDYSPSSLSFHFEEIESVNEDFLLKLFPKYPKWLNLDIWVITKNDYDWMSFIPDYFLWTISEVLKWTKDDTRSFSDKLFALLADKISFLSILNEDNERSYFHFRKGGKEEFYNTFWWKYKGRILV